MKNFLICNMLIFCFCLQGFLFVPDFQNFCFDMSWYEFADSFPASSNLMLKSLSEFLSSFIVLLRNLSVWLCWVLGEAGGIFCCGTEVLSLWCGGSVVNGAWA